MAERLAKHKVWLVPLAVTFCSLAAGAVYWSPALKYWYATGFGDWQQFQHQWEAGHVAISRYGEFPLWNPWHCGGVFIWGDPQAQVYSPIYHLLRPFGTTIGLKLFLILHAAAGFGGMALFARRHLELSWSGASMAALVWAGSGFFAWHGSGGHSAFLPFYFAPWLLLAWRWAATEWRASALVAAIMALVLLEGGVYPFPYFCLLLVFDGIVQMTDANRRRGVVKAGLIALPLMALMGSFRIIPILNTMSRYPRETTGDDYITFREFLEMLTSRHYDYGFPAHEYLWAEYGTFIGWTALVLGLAGILLCLRERRWVVAGALLFGGLTMGHVTPFHPWPLLHHLPVFDSLRVPSRFVVFFVFFLALGAGTTVHLLSVFLSRYKGRLRTVWPRAIPLILLAIVVGQLYWGNYGVIDRWRRPGIPEVDPTAEYHVIPYSEYPQMASFPARNVSTQGCYTGIEAYFASSSLIVGEHAQARVANGELQSYSRTANTMTVEVRLLQPGKVTFNQTWAAGWRTNIGRVARGHSGLILVEDVPAGEHTVELRYVPNDLYLASGLGGTGLLASLLVGFWPRRRKKFEKKAPAFVAGSDPKPHAQPDERRRDRRPLLQRSGADST